MVESQVAICINLAALPGRRLLIVLGMHRYSSHANQGCQEQQHGFSKKEYDSYDIYHHPDLELINQRLRKGHVCERELLRREGNIHLYADGIED